MGRRKQASFSIDYIRVCNNVIDVDGEKLYLIWL